MNQDIFEGKWDQVKGTIKKTWGKISDDDLNKVQGQKDKLIGLIQELYGETKEEIDRKINTLLMMAPISHIREEIIDFGNKKTDEIQEYIKKHPISAAAWALGIGFLIGSFLTRSK